MFWFLLALKLEPSSLHWFILVFLYAFFIQWSILPNKKNKKSILPTKLNSYTISYPNPPPPHPLPSFIPPKELFCGKRASKMIVPPKEMLLSFSIGTFLTNYDVTIRKQWKGLLCFIVRKRTIWGQNKSMETTSLVVKILTLSGRRSSEVRCPITNKLQYVQMV